MTRDEPGWWGSRWHPDPEAGQRVLSADDLLVSPLVPAELRNEGLAAGGRLALTIGGHTLWEPAGGVIWAQPNILGVAETPPPEPPTHQLVAVDAMVAPLVERPRAAVWTPRGTMRIGSGERGPVAAARRAVAAGHQLAGACRSTPGVRLVDSQPVRRVPVLVEGEREAAAQRVRDAGCAASTPVVAGLAGLVVCEPGADADRGLIRRVAAALRGSAASIDDPRAPSGIPVPTIRIP